MLQSNRGKPVEEAPTIVVVLRHAYKRHGWNRVPLVEKISTRILIDANRYRTMKRNEREPHHARRIVLPAFGQLWQAYVEAETGTPSIVEEAMHSGKNPSEELERLIQDVKDEVRRQPSEVGSALLEFNRTDKWFETLVECIRSPFIDDQRLLLRLNDSVDAQKVSQQFHRLTETWASIILEEAFGRYLPEDEQAELVTQIAKGARRDFMKECVVVAKECDNAHVSDDARRRRLRDALRRCLLHRFEAIWEYRTTLNDRLRPPRQGFEQYDNVLRHIEADVSTHGGTLKQRAEDLGVPVGDVYDCLRRKKYRDKR